LLAINQLRQKRPNRISMRILFLTQIVPFPPDAGPKVKTWHVLRYLVEAGHEVTLLTYVRQEEKNNLPPLEKLCHQVVTVPIQRSRLKDMGYMLRSFLNRRPFLIERDDLAPMRSAMKRLLAENDFDVIHADQLSMVQFAFPGRQPQPAANRRPAVVFDAHNAVWTIVRRSQETANWVLKPIFWREAAALKKYEGQLVASCDHTLAVTEIDEEALLQAADAHTAPLKADLQSRISVVPIAVDTQVLQPARRSPDSNHIVTLGTLHYPPNADGIRWFAREVFPLIQQALPNAYLTIIGKNPPADFQQMAEQQPDAVRVTGYVPELDPFMEAAAVLVVPVRAGGGMRVRILEAFARAMPVVTTTIGLEGIQAKPDIEVLVQDQPEAFAEAVVNLLRDQEQQNLLAINGRKLAEQRYDWQVVLQQMEAVYAGLSPKMDDSQAVIESAAA
jgi:glycosyltransferase involved in cell wall biosynthesis